MNPAILLIFAILANRPAKKESPMARELKRMKFGSINWDVPSVGKDIKKIETKSGTTLYLKENHSLPLIEITIYTKGGPAYLENGQRLPCNLIANTLIKAGTKTFSPDELVDSLECNAIKVTSESYDEYFVFSIQFQPEFAPLAMKLMREMLFEPRFDETVVNTEKLRVADEWQRDMDIPQRLLSEISRTIIFKGHPLGIRENLETFDTLSRNFLVELHRKFFQPQNMVVSVVGDFSFESFSEDLINVFNDKYNTGLILNAQKALPLEERKVYFCQRPIPQGYVYFLQDAPSGYFDDIYKVLLMTDILGGGFNSKIVSKVRNELGLAYETYAYISFMSIVKGVFYAFSATRADAVVNAIYYLEDAIKKMENGEISQDELTFSKDSFLSSSVTAIRSDWGYVKRLALRSLFGFPDDYFEKMRNEIGKLNIEDIREASRRYLNHEKMSIVVVGDSSKIDMEKLSDFGTIEFIEY